jgi:hypothetical protein
MGENPLTPSELTIEWAISKCPGDMNYYKSAVGAVTEVSSRSGTTSTYYPCGTITGWSSGQLRWSPTGSSYECKVTDGSNWYINVRYLNGTSFSACNSSTGCPIGYAYSQW